MLWPTILGIIGALSGACLAVELTFELPDNAKQCFYEEIKENTKTRIEFQVIIGGNYDVDLVVSGPGNAELFKYHQKQFDSLEFTTQSSGVYSACFSNEFSTFSHKLVYMNFQAGEEKPLPGQAAEKQSAMTMMENLMDQIHKNLNTVGDFQTHYRLRENHGRKIAEDLNSRVMWYSAVESFAICSVFLTYVVVMKGFFSDKKSIR